jgi:hypothetical protein
MPVLITGGAGVIGSYVADQAPEDLVPVAARELEQRGLTV